MLGLGVVSGLVFVALSLSLGVDSGVVFVALSLRLGVDSGLVFIGTEMSPEAVLSAWSSDTFAGASSFKAPGTVKNE